MTRRWIELDDDDLDAARLELGPRESPTPFELPCVMWVGGRPVRVRSNG